MIDTIKTDKYTDITNSWLKNKQYGHNNCNVIDAKYYVYNNIKYNVDKKNVILDYSKQERRIALWLCNTFGSNVYMMPRINYPNGIMTADYLFKNEYWDLKTIKGSGKRSIEDELFSNIEKFDNIIEFIIEKNDNNIFDKNRLLKLLSVDSFYRTFDSYFIGDTTEIIGKGILLSKKIFNWRCKHGFCFISKRN